MLTLTNETLSTIKWDGAGLVAAIVQDSQTNQVLMMAYMNQDALRETLASGQAVFWSRSRGRLWRKGETSGNVQQVVEIRIDCDADTLLLRVVPSGPACHTGAVSCFYRTLDAFNQKPERH